MLAMPPEGRHRQGEITYSNSKGHYIKETRKVRKNSLLIIAAITAWLSFSACEIKFKPGETNVANNYEIKRYDRLESRYLTTGDFSALQQMNTDYPIETRTLIEKMLQLGTITDPTISNTFLMFYQDTTLQVLIADAEAEFADMSDVNAELKEAFEKLQKWLPSVKLPSIYAQIGALDQSIVVGDNSIGISLDKYMGEGYPLYKRFYTQQQRATMTRLYIAPDCITFYLLSLYPMQGFDHCPQLERDLHMGKIMWVANKAIGREVFRNPYIQTISSYMKHNPNVTVQQLLEMNDDSAIKTHHKE